MGGSACKECSGGLDAKYMVTETRYPEGQKLFCSKACYDVHYDRQMNPLLAIFGTPKEWRAAAATSALEARLKAAELG